MSASAAQPPYGRPLPPPRPCGDGVFGFDPRDLAAYYRFPDGFDGTGTTIALVSLSGALRRSDVDTYFSAMPGAAPAIEVIEVDGARSDPDTDAAVALGVEVLGSAAPGARLAVYVTGGTEFGMKDGLSSAVYSTQHPADVICLDWTVVEASVRSVLVKAIGETVEEATAMGLPVCAPAGFWAGGKLQPVFPGTHPLALACGATWRRGRAMVWPSSRWRTRPGRRRPAPCGRWIRSRHSRSAGLSPVRPDGWCPT